MGFPHATSCIAVAIAACSPIPSHVMEGHADGRIAVEFPGALRDHMLRNMRDHLDTLQRIEDALARGSYDEAARLSETRLGLTSLSLHGAHDVAPYMPEGMQAIGTEMHKAASRFSIEASSAGATGDPRPALRALALVMGQCVACHAAYRLKP